MKSLDARRQTRFKGALTLPIVGLVLTAGCAVSRPEPTRPPEAAERIVETQESIQIGGGASYLHPYQTEGVNPNNPAFGALTVTILIDGRRHHFGVGG